MAGGKVASAESPAPNPGFRERGTPEVTVSLCGKCVPFHTPLNEEWNDRKQRRDEAPEYKGEREPVAQPAKREQRHVCHEEYAVGPANDLHCHGKVEKVFQGHGDTQQEQVRNAFDHCGGTENSEKISHR